ncbi:hypothetical protein LZ24_00335 [Desulfobotulus alkaliphilus]|uniref:HAMP domain-containing protein n=1 Tax=Desulfobotulus alkaliphilus TaxID=622671 RepID=A0A562S7P8_9BACT|nr:hypothetical protein [Desulfobotulus alkaliphilus]TWI76714.1 hypothetical protein LZ24_00335 [Desulfobotulus alkaliphilus]
MLLENQREDRWKIRHSLPRFMKGLLRRRRFFVSPAFQLSLTWRILLLMMLAVGITATIDAWFYLVFLDQRMMINVNMAYLNKFIAILLLVLIGGAVWTLRLTHRIAGPVYRIIRVLEKTGDHGKTKVCLRKNDLLQELAQPVNATLALLNEQRLRIHLARKDLNSLLEQMAEGERNEEDVIRQIREAVRRLDGE